MEFTLNTKKLAAVLTHSAVKDVRYYLNGVLIERQGGILRIVATDGSRLMVWRVGPDEGSDFQAIMPSDFVKSCVKVKDKEVAIAIAEGRVVCQQAGAMALLIEGKFPDWRRVCSVQEAEESPGTYNPDFLADLAKASKLAGWSRHGDFAFQQRGNHAAPFTIGPDIAGVVVPRRYPVFQQCDFNVIVNA